MEIVKEIQKNSLEFRTGVASAVYHPTVTQKNLKEFRNYLKAGMKGDHDARAIIAATVHNSMNAVADYIHGRSNSTEFIPGKIILTAPLQRFISNYEIDTTWMELVDMIPVSPADIHGNMLSVQRFDLIGELHELESRQQELKYSNVGSATAKNINFKWYGGGYNAEDTLVETMDVYSINSLISRLRVLALKKKAKTAYANIIATIVGSEAFATDDITTANNAGLTLFTRCVGDPTSDSFTDQGMGITAETPMKIISNLKHRSRISKMLRETGMTDSGAKQIVDWTIDARYSGHMPSNPGGGADGYLLMYAKGGILHAGTGEETNTAMSWDTASVKIGHREGWIDTSLNFKGDVSNKQIIKVLLA